MLDTVSGRLVAFRRPFADFGKLFLIAALGLLLVAATVSHAQEAVERHTLDALDAYMANGPVSNMPIPQGDMIPQQMQNGPSPAITGVDDGAGGNDGDANANVPAPSFVMPEDSQNSITLIKDKPPLRMGLVAEQGASYLQARIEPFRKYLQQSLSRPVEVVAYKSMPALMAAHIGRQIDYSIYPASIFSMAYASCGCLTPLVAPVSRQAPDGIYMLLVVRGASGIKSLADLSGRTMALSSRNGAIPFYMAMNELKKSGLNPERDLDSLVARDNPQDALKLLEEGEVDAALVWSSTPYNQNIFTSEGAIAAYTAASQRGRQSGPNPDFISIWHSPAIPAGPHVIHNEISKQEKADLVNALKDMEQQAPDAYDAIERRYDGGFRSVTLKDYDPLIEIATKR